MQIKAWHTFLRCFYRKQTLLQIKTADHENKTLDGLKPEVDDAWNFTLMQPIQEWSTSWSHYALEHYKTPHYPFQGGSHCLQGMSPLWPSLPGKVIKATLFCFISMFLFSTVEQRPSFGNNYTIYYIRCVVCDYVQVQCAGYSSQSTFMAFSINLCPCLHKLLHVVIGIYTLLTEIKSKLSGPDFGNYSVLTR